MSDQIIKKDGRPTFFSGEYFYYVECEHATGGKVMVIAESIEKAKPQLIKLLYYNNKQFWHDPKVSELIELLMEA
ncbi:MAG: hypothetical protein ACFFDN_00080 [Candidatus Hodarchaeota archaeon]